LTRWISAEGDAWLAQGKEFEKAGEEARFDVTGRVTGVSINMTRPFKETPEGERVETDGAPMISMTLHVEPNDVAVALRK